LLSVDFGMIDILRFNCGVILTLFLPWSASRVGRPALRWVSLCLAWGAGKGPCAKEPV